MTDEYNPATANVYTGICVGGPMDGQQLAHHVTRYRLMRNNPRFTFDPPATDCGLYLLEDDAWQWKGWESDQP